LTHSTDHRAQRPILGEAMKPPRHEDDHDVHRQKNANSGGDRAERAGDEPPLQT